MVTKELIKKEIDKLPDSDLDKVYEIVHQLIDKKRIAPKRIKTVNLKGRFDNIDIRKESYE